MPFPPPQRDPAQFFAAPTRSSSVSRFSGALAVCFLVGASIRDGGTGYGWFGGGLRDAFDNVTCFGELGAIVGLNEDKRFDSNQAAFAIGLLFHYSLKKK